MRIYLSGPITGQPNYRRVFREAKALLEEQGYHDIVNPAELCEVIPKSYPYKDIMTICIDLLSNCDAVLLLPGWEKSHGCGREIGYAEAMDLIVMEFEDFLNRR